VQTPPRSAAARNLVCSAPAPAYPAGAGNAGAPSGPGPEHRLLALLLLPIHLRQPQFLPTLGAGDVAGPKLGRQTIPLLPVNRNLGGIHANQPEGGILAQPLGVMDLLVTGQATVDRLPKQIGQRKLGVLAAPGVAQRLFDELSPAEPFVPLARQNQAPVGADPRTLEVVLPSRVAGKLKRLILFLTPWVSPSRRG
jgi:hypothetical protein